MRWMRSIRKPFEGEVWRVTSKGREALRGSSTHGRWSPNGDFEVLYTSLAREGALTEIGHHLSLEPVWPSRLQHEIHRIEVRTVRTLHIADLDALQRLGVDVARYHSFDYEATPTIRQLRTSWRSTDCWSRARGRPARTSWRPPSASRSQPASRNLPSAQLVRKVRVLRGAGSPALSMTQAAAPPALMRVASTPAHPAVPRLPGPRRLDPLHDDGPVPGRAADRVPRCPAQTPAARIAALPRALLRACSLREGRRSTRASSPHWLCSSRGSN